MPKKRSQEYKNYTVSIIENDVITSYPVIDMVGDSVEYDEGVLRIQDAKKFFDKNTGGIHYLFNLDLPSVVEANNLKLLRRSTVINNLFKYDKAKKMDIMSFMPWIVVMLLIFFK